jgi:predicted GNAT family N-acyltransferase
MIEIQEARKGSQMLTLFEIRRHVFVIEQEVDAAEEYDEFESSSTHFIAKYKGVAAATCRYRTTEKGIKLERFAVLKSYRGKGIGAALVKKCLEKIGETDLLIYLHAQLHAVPFYEKLGFKPTGPQFSEAGIEHFKMHYVTQ